MSKPPPEQRDDSFLLSLLSQYSGGSAKPAAKPVAKKPGAGPAARAPQPRPVALAVGDDDLGEVYTPQLASATQVSAAIKVAGPPAKKRKLDGSAAVPGPGAVPPPLAAARPAPPAVPPSSASEITLPEDDVSLPSFVAPSSAPAPSPVAPAPAASSSQPLPPLLLAMYASDRQRGVTAEALATRLQRPMLLDSSHGTTFLASVGANAWDAEARGGRRARAAAAAAAAAAAGRPQAAADGGGYLTSTHGVVTYEGVPPRTVTRAQKVAARGRHPLGRTARVAQVDVTSNKGKGELPELSMAVVLAGYAAWCQYVVGMLTTAAAAQAAAPPSASSNGGSGVSSAGRGGMVTLEALKAQEAGRRDVAAASGQGAERLRLEKKDAPTAVLPGLTQTQALLTPPVLSLLDWHFAFLTVTRCVADPSLVGTCGYVRHDGAGHFVLYRPPPPPGSSAGAAAGGRSVTVPKDGSWFTVAWPVPARFSAATASGSEGKAEGRAMGPLLEKLVKAAKAVCSTAGAAETEGEGGTAPKEGPKLEIASSLLPACVSTAPLDVLHAWLDKSSPAGPVFAQRLLVELVGSTLLKPAVHPVAQVSTPLSAPWVGGSNGSNTLLGKAKARPRRRSNRRE